MRKRRREDTNTNTNKDGPTTTITNTNTNTTNTIIKSNSNTTDNTLDVVLPALVQQQQQQNNNNNKRRRFSSSSSAAAAAASGPLSFTFSPTTILPIWQRVVLSTLHRLHSCEADSRRAEARGRALYRDLTRYHEDLHRREERIRAQQRDSRARLGNKLFNAIEKQWTRRGDVFQQLLCVEFDEVKRRHTEKRQEDLLREAENLTRTLLDSIFTDARSRTGDGDSDNTAVIAALQGDDNDDDVNDCKNADSSSHIMDNNSSSDDESDGSDDDDDDSNISSSSNNDSNKSETESTIKEEKKKKKQKENKISKRTLESSVSLLDTQDGRRPLRDYQRSALRWMTNLYTKKLNGILADEMGLGKTVQTIALLAYFAEHLNDWGPHLIVVPTTVVLNWKAEFIRWCPALKVLVYIGNPKERHRLRKGWMGEDAFHVCITSYNLVVRERAIFRRRPWGFLVLDEAHQVKNFMSKKWQSLFDLQAEYRLLLTGTPLQNSIMELWSLFHFLLPFASAFSSNEEFREWFSNPMEDMVTGKVSLNEEIVRRLQSLLRPFMLRRLKKDVESQLPSKTEKVVMCQLSRRQRLLYDDYMQLTETRERIRGGAGGVLGVLLALRKVCNHPDMFEERRTISPMGLDNLSEITMLVPRNILLRDNDYSGCYRFQKWRLCVEDLSLPFGKQQQQYEKENEERGGGEETFFNDSWLDCTYLHVLKLNQSWGQEKELYRREELHRYSPDNFHWPTQKPLEEILMKSHNGEVSNTLFSMLCGEMRQEQACIHQRRKITTSIQSKRFHRLEASICVWYPKCLQIVEISSSYNNNNTNHTNTNNKHKRIPAALCPTITQRVAAIMPIACKVAVYVPRVAATFPPKLHCLLPVSHYHAFCAHTRKSLAPLLAISMPSSSSSSLALGIGNRKKYDDPRKRVFDGSLFLSELWPLHVRRCFSFPDKRLLIHDCGKLQFLECSLKQLRREGHRMLIFTQFVHMLNILERFLAIIGIPYLRIDGSTAAEKRQAFVDRFNEDDRITCMILSTRSGGIGLNLTGADTVIFYDSDWNPTMDLQAQDRCHRIGQTKPVTIYRLISEHTVEESILQKARERKKLNNVVIRGGQFHAMAGVEDTYEDTSAALAALSDPVRLRSFFHDLDEDATVLVDQENTKGQIKVSKDNNNNNNTFKNNNSNDNTFDTSDITTVTTEVDIRAEMMKLEDQEDREAQQNVEEELRVLEEQKRNDEAELGGEDEDDDDDDDEEDDIENENENDEDKERRRQRRRQERRQRRREQETMGEDEMFMGIPTNTSLDSSNPNSTNNNNNNTLMGVSGGESLLLLRRESPAVMQKRRDALRRLRTPLDRLLSLHFGTSHAAEARQRYEVLCEKYAAQVDEEELPPFRDTFRL